MKDQLMEEGAPLPTQNQLYALYMHLCGQYHIRKPNKTILELLMEDNFSRDIRRAREAKELFLAVDELPEEPSDAPDQVAAREHLVPLALRKSVPLQGKTLHLGNSGVCALLELLVECPLLEELDLSTVGSFFCPDPYKLCPTGNDVVHKLCQVASTHPRLSTIDLSNNPLGTDAGRMLFELVRTNTRITVLQFDEHGVDAKMVKDIQKQLERNASTTSEKRPLPPQLSERVKALAEVDRKSSQQLQALHLLLWEERTAFASLSTEQLSNLVLKAVPMSLSEVVQSCRGLRGDETHLYLIESGELHATIGTQASILTRGDYFGEPLETVMYSGGTLSVGKRGTAFRIPFDVCGDLFKVWEEQVDRHLPSLRTVACLQALPLWTLIRACHEAQLHHCTAGEKVILRSEEFVGLHIVTGGAFSVPQKKGDGRLEFSIGDVFGEEASVTRHRCNSVDIVADSPTAGADVNGPVASCLRLAPRLSRQHIVNRMRGMFRLQARHYSLYDDV